MKISRKLFMGFSFVIVLAIVVGAIGIMGMQNLRNSALMMYEKQVVGLEYAGKATAAFKQVRVEMYQVLISSLYDDLKGAVDAKEQFETYTKDFEFWMNESCNVASTDESVKFHEKIMELFHEIYLPTAEKIIEESISDIPYHVNKLHINVLRASTVDVSTRIEKLLLGLLELDTALARKMNNENARVTQLFIIVQYLLLVAAVIVAVVVAYYIIKSITMPIKEASGVLKEIAKGNFDARVMGDYKGDFELIKISVNNTAIKLSLYLAEKIQAEHSTHEAELEKAKVEAASEAVFANISYARKIQESLLPKENIFKEAFSDYSIIWEPRDKVGGDIYWIKSFVEGTILCVCDCTGHGTSGALLTMLVASILDTSVTESNYKDPAAVIWELEQRLINILHVDKTAGTEGRTGISEIQDGCDLAVLYIAKDGHITISSGNTHVFICDGREVTQIKGQRLHIGEGKLKRKEDVQLVNIPANPEHKFYISSDGIFDQIGGETGRPFGYRTYKSILLENHSENQAAISEKIWEAFENYRGDQMRRDDVELITFKP